MISTASPVERIEARICFLLITNKGAHLPRCLSLVISFLYFSGLGSISAVAYGF